MSKEDAKRFLREYRNNREAIRIWEQSPRAKSEDEWFSLVVEVAGKLGIRFTKEELVYATREYEEEQRIRVDTLSSDLVALDDDDLEQAAGGYSTTCWVDEYCYMTLSHDHDGDNDKPCWEDYNCTAFSKSTTCEKDYFYTDSQDFG